MSKREHENRERDKHEHGKPGHKEEERGHRPHGTGFGTERSAYLKFLERKWEGSAPPTAEAYGRALKQWRQLPGSVVTTAADLGIEKTVDSLDNSNQPPANNGPDEGSKS